MTSMPPNGESEREEFDYVIIGAGASAMGLVHGLLSRFDERPPCFSIAVLERGSGPPHAKNTALPQQWCDASHKQSSSVQLVDSLIGNRVIDVPVGKGLGGTTNINACLCIAPSSEDFKAWPAPWNESMVASLGVIQEEMIKNHALHTHHGESSCCSCLFDDSKVKQHSKQENSSFPAGVPLSIARNEDGTFVRRNYYEALVEPILQNSPLLSNCVTFFLGFEAQRLLFDENDHRVVGVKGRGPRNASAIYARQEVILSAGAIESPALLLISGIGHEQDLKRASIQPKRKRSRAGVGRMLRDHVLVPFVFLSRWSPRTLSPNGVHVIGLNEDKEGDRFHFVLNDSAVYSQLVPHFVASFIRRRISHPRRVKHVGNFIMTRLFEILRLLLRMLVSCTPIYFVLQYSVITINVALMNPKSTGTVSIRPRKPSSTAYPLQRKDVDILVDAGYLRDPDDVVSLKQGFNVLSQRFERFKAKYFELLPGLLFRGASVIGREAPFEDKCFGAYLSHFALPYFHWSSSCAMKTEDNAEWVVDSRLCLRDIPGLRVCDASVFPGPVSAPTALACAALGHAFADLLVHDHGKKQL